MTIISNVNYTTDVTIDASDVELTNVSIENGGDVNINFTGSVIVKGSYETGTTLEIEDK